MRNLFSSIRTLGLFGLLSLLSFSGSVHAEESSIRLSNPFLLPQTSFFIGSMNNSVSLSNSPQTYGLNNGGMNTYGFDIEVNANNYMNIGAYFRVESLKGVERPISAIFFVDSQFAAFVGGFTRFFYVPPFLKGKELVTNVFVRLELGGGPTSMGSPGGLLLQGGGHIGVESYINKWLGVSLSYGKTIEWGKETFVSGGEYPSPFKGTTIWNQGSVVLASVKTTFL